MTAIQRRTLALSIACQQGYLEYYDLPTEAQIQTFTLAAVLRTAERLIQPNFHNLAASCKTLTAHGQKHRRVIQLLYQRFTFMYLRVNPTAPPLAMALKGLAELDHRDKDGKTPLYKALTADFPNEDRALRLIRLGVDIEDIGPGRVSALMMAAYRSLREAIPLLLDMKANVNAKPADDTTPLIYAARGGDAHIVQQLLTARADPHPMDDRDQTALDWARFCAPACIPLLEQAEKEFPKKA
jgi:hypothetical protein